MRLLSEGDNTRKGVVYSIMTGSAEIRGNVMGHFNGGTHIEAFYWGRRSRVEEGRFSLESQKTEGWKHGASEMGEKGARSARRVRWARRARNVRRVGCARSVWSVRRVRGLKD